MSSRKMHHESHKIRRRGELFGEQAISVNHSLIGGRNLVPGTSLSIGQAGLRDERFDENRQ